MPPISSSGFNARIVTGIFLTHSARGKREVDKWPSDVAIDADGGILIAGSFTNVNCVAQPYLVRLIPSDTPDVIDCLPEPPKPPPELTVTRLRRARMVTCWPTNYPEYSLQATRRLRPKRPHKEKWVTITRTPVCVDGTCCVTNKIVRFGKHYRLWPTKYVE